MYYPKSKILENQYTSGGELQDSSGKSYKGAYHVTYDGNYYTGATHKIDSKQLTPVAKGSILPGSPATGSASDVLNVIPLVQNDLYTSLNHISQTLNQALIPEPFYPIPVDQDYSIGQLTRYFMKRVNDPRITEISAQGIQDVASNVLYTTLQLQWKLTGPVYDDLSNPNMPVYGIFSTNFRTVTLIKRKMPGIDLYLKNLLEFSK